MGHVFISYSHRDKDYAHRLADFLRDQGFDIWVDDRLDYGSQWPEEIQEHLDGSAAFIVIMTPRSYESDWVQNELSRAKRKGKPIFPLLLEGGETWLTIETTQYADVRGGKMPDAKFLATLRRAAAGPEAGAAPAASEWPFGGESPQPASKRFGPAVYAAGIGVVVLLLVGGAWLAWPWLSQLFNPPATGVPTVVPTELPTAMPTEVPTDMPGPSPDVTADVTPAGTPFEGQVDKLFFSYDSDVNGNRDIFLYGLLTGQTLPVMTNPSNDKVGTWSPDGRYLAFESNRNSTGGQYYQIYVYDTVAEASTRLTELADCSNWSPAWSPDGQKIALYSNCENNERQIFIMNRDGSGRKRLTSGKGPNQFPAFSPDGNTITFTSARSGAFQIFLMDVNGSNERVIADGCKSTFSPDGEWVWFSATCDDSPIWRVRKYGTDLTPVGGTVVGQNPVVSPDGGQVVFQSGGHIWVMNAEGANPLQMTYGISSDEAPAWRFVP